MSIAPDTNTEWPVVPIIERAKNSSNECHVCRDSIRTNSLCIGKLVQDNGEGQPVATWFHLQCVQPDDVISKFDDLIGVKKLTQDEQIQAHEWSQGKLYGPRNWAHITMQGDRFAVKFRPGDKAFADKVTRVLPRTERVWDPMTRSLLLPVTCVAPINTLVTKHGFELSEEAAAVFSGRVKLQPGSTEIKQQPQPQPQQQKLTEAKGRWIRHNALEKRLEVRYPFEPNLHAHVKDITTKPSRMWVAEQRLWQIKKSGARKLLDLVENHGFRMLDRTTEAWIYEKTGGKRPGGGGGAGDSTAEDEDAIAEEAEIKMPLGSQQQQQQQALQQQQQQQRGGVSPAAAAAVAAASAAAAAAASAPDAAPIPFATMAQLKQAAPMAATAATPTTTTTTAPVGFSGALPTQEASPQQPQPVSLAQQQQASPRLPVAQSTPLRPLPTQLQQSSQQPPPSPLGPPPAQSLAPPPGFQPPPLQQFLPPQTPSLEQQPLQSLQPQHHQQQQQYHRQPPMPQGGPLQLQLRVPASAQPQASQPQQPQPAQGAPLHRQQQQPESLALADTAMSFESPDETNGGAGVGSSGILSSTTHWLQQLAPEPSLQHQQLLQQLQLQQQQLQQQQAAGGSGDVEMEPEEGAAAAAAAMGVGGGGGGLEALDETEQVMMEEIPDEWDRHGKKKGPKTARSRKRKRDEDEYVPSTLGEQGGPSERPVKKYKYQKQKKPSSVVVEEPVPGTPWEKLKALQLRMVMKRQGLKPRGKKADFVAALMAHYNTRVVPDNTNVIVEPDNDQPDSAPIPSGAAGAGAAPGPWQQQQQQQAAYLRHQQMMAAGGYFGTYRHDGSSGSGAAAGVGVGGGGGGSAAAPGGWYSSSSTAAMFSTPGGPSAFWQPPPAPPMPMPMSMAPPSRSQQQQGASLPVGGAGQQGMPPPPPPPAQSHPPPMPLQLPGSTAFGFMPLPPLPSLPRSGPTQSQQQPQQPMQQAQESAETSSGGTGIGGGDTGQAGEASGLPTGAAPSPTPGQQQSAQQTQPEQPPAAGAPDSSAARAGQAQQLIA